MSAAKDRGLALRNSGIALAIVALAATAAFVWWRGRPSTPDHAPAEPVGAAVGAAGVDAAGKRSPADRPGPSVVEPGTPGDGRAAAVDADRRIWRSRLGAEPDFPDPLHGAAACEEVDAGFERVCRAIDPGAAGAGCAALRDAATRLAASGPTLPEARSTEAWLRNAFLLFRVLGEERISDIRGLIDAEPALVEPLALAAYRWAITRSSCRDGAEPIEALTPARLYEYAAFGFTSFGGQAYLRRRAPRLEALGCFYALSALEFSIEQGHNPLGVDARREIDRCRALVAGQTFVWSGAYARELDRIALAWRRRVGEG